MDGVTGILDGLLSLGLPGIIAVYFIQRSINLENKIDTLRREYDAKLETEHKRYDDIQQKRIDELKADVQYTTRQDRRPAQLREVEAQKP